ncbi:alpha-2-macroglobulin family protein [Fusobacterium russii]|uniref:alpha-2-macroglobulin family protein n=1 Tax=Fusobacterium russii TaxID=854 RepID=UPI0003A7431F|nr:alpha-2-macroglobulin [Fusobacterium russii]
MKKNIFFKILLIILAFSLLACNNKNKKEITAKENINQTENVVNNVDYYSELYLDRVAFNSAGHLVAIFSNEISKEQDLKSKISLEPEVSNLEIETYGGKIVLKGNFEKEVPYKLTFAQDLKDIDGNELGNSYPFSNLYIGKLKPSLSFSDNALTLPSLNNKRINFTSVNVKKVKLEIVKVYMNNITDFLKSKNYTYFKETFKEDLGDVVFSKEYVLDSKTDEVMRNSIDLTGIIDSKGVYNINIFVNNPDDIDYEENKYGYIDYYEWIDGGRVYARAEKNIILSDLGLIANSNANKLEVKAINLNTLETLPHTRLQFINKKNQVIEEGYTVSNGEYKSKLNPDEVMYVLAKNNNEFNVLYLNESYLNYSDFDIGGLVEDSNLKLFTYTDKGYYRPGDDIHISLIARNKNLPLEENHPFTYSFISPNGIEKLNNVTVNESKNGFYNFNIKSDINDETGAWNLKIKFGGKEINQPVFIEAKTPNRIAIDIDTNKIYTKEDIKNNNLTVEVLGTYLTGVKASNSATNYNVSIFEKEFETKKYKNFTFTNPTSEFMYNTYFDGSLDGNGKENLNIFIPETAKKYNLDIFINANILDTNGRYSTETKRLTLINNDFSIGLQKNIEEENRATVNFIVLDQKADKLIEGKKLKYRLFNKKYNWWYDSYEDDESRIKNSFDTIVLQEGELVSSLNPQTIKLDKLEDGINFLEVEDPETGISSGIFIYNYSYGDRANNGMENLSISSDKEKYSIGESAKIKYNGTEGAKALITIEKDGKILKEYWRNLSQKNNEESIQIEKDFFPNVYVNISVFQKYQNKENDRPLRLYGTVPLMISDKEKELSLVIDSKAEAEPSSNYKLKVYNKERQKMYFQYFIIDEGVTRLTDYKLPKPFDFFYGKQAKLIKTYDNFSNIIEKYSNKGITNYLKTGGGDFEEAAMAKAYMEENMNLQGKAERFKNIAIVSPILETDQNGYAEIDIKIPNYFGAMKIFVVAAKDEKFGSAEKKLTVKAPVIVESSAPRVLKVGDKFSVPITLFPMEDDLGDGKLTIKYAGKDFTKEVKFTNKENQKFSFDLVAPETVGETKIDISFTSTKYNFKDSIDINVDSSYPQQYISEATVLKSGKEFKINANDFKDFIKSSLNSDLKLTSYENLGLNKVIASLLDYPYICLEQTASKARAMLAITHLTTDVNELNIARNEINKIIKKLFNNYQLSNGGFTYWPGSKYDEYVSSIYTIEFLAEARDHGYYVPEQMYNKAIEYIKSLIYRADVTPENKASALYILAKVGEPNVSEMNIIFDKYYKNWPLQAKWLLLNAYNQIGEKDFAKNEANKLQKITNSDNTLSNYKKAEILKHYYSIYGERDKELFNSLLSVVKSDTWLSTYTQASIIDALSKSVKDIEKKDLSFDITVNGETKAYNLKNGQFKFHEINKILKENKKIIIKNTSSDNIYVDFLVKGKPTKYKEKDESNNIVIARDFIDMDGNKVDPKKLKVGDKIYIVINTELKNLSYLDNIALTQILPSGWEFSNVESDSGYAFDYIDKRDDRISVFYSQGSDQPKNIKIAIDIVTPGEYFFSGTSVAAMYDNNFKAYLKGFEVKVLEK